jgi:dipeptidyl aminopeptidase/acylaminoacyl peptidase
VLILHGDADDVVPVAEAYELAACLTATKRLEIFKDTDHRLSDSAVMQRAMAAALAWLVEHVR